MDKQKKIVISHPNGNANVRGAANGFFNAAILESFHTSIACYKGGWLYRLAKGPLKEFRRREYSVLRSIGLTEKQLYKVIIGEGMCYSILSICMTLLIGTPIAMLICRQMSISCYGKVVEYSFPFFYMSIYVFVLLLIQVILSIYQIREQKKKSIIDQLRME